jgi:hypothetical protein
MNDAIGYGRKGKEKKWRCKVLVLANSYQAAHASAIAAKILFCRGHVTTYHARRDSEEFSTAKRLKRKARPDAPTLNNLNHLGKNTKMN